MIIEKVSLVNVRKIKQFSETFSPTTTIITGKNGTGKTTILEAIFFLLTTKSFRKKYNKSIITKNQRELQIKGTISPPQRTIIMETKKQFIKTTKQ